MLNNKRKLVRWELSKGILRQTTTNKYNSVKNATNFNWRAHIVIKLKTAQIIITEKLLLEISQKTIYHRKKYMRNRSISAPFHRKTHHKKWKLTKNRTMFQRMIRSHNWLKKQTEVRMLWHHREIRWNNSKESQQNTSWEAILKEKRQDLIQN